MAVVPDAGEPLSPQTADLVRRIARMVLDEPADLMAEVHAAVWYRRLLARKPPGNNAPDLHG